MIVFSAKPMGTYSSLHRVSLPQLVGLGGGNLVPFVRVSFDFGLRDTAEASGALLALRVCDEDKVSDGGAQFRISNLLRWRVDLRDFEGFNSFLHKMNSRHYARYVQAKKTFKDYGATVRLIEGDWSEHAEVFYRLYCRVAERHGARLYDHDFICAIAKDPKYQLLTAWYEGEMIAAMVLIDECPVLHSMIAGFDYHHSSNALAYSWMHYELVRIGIEAGRYTTVDIGLTANGAKSSLDFKPVPVCIEVTARSAPLRVLLRVLSRFMSASINAEGKLELSQRR